MFSRRRGTRFNRGRAASRATGPSGPDVSPPAILSATIPAAGTTLVLVYAEALDETSVPAAGDYALAGTAVAVDAVDSVSGNTVTLGLDGVVSEDEAGITLDYTAGVNPVRDVAENDAENLNDYAVTNESTADVTDPEFVSAAIPADGLSLTLTYNELLDTGSVPDAGDFALTGTAAGVDSVDVVGSTVVLTLDAEVLETDTVTLDYTPGVNPIQDSAGNDAAALNDEAVTNNSEVAGGDTTPPTFTWVASADGLTTVGTANEDCDQTSTPAAGDFSFGSTRVTVGSVAWTSATTIELTHASHRMTGDSFETPTVSYTPGVNPIRDLALNEADAIVAAAIDNTASIHAPMIHIETLLSGTSWTSPADLYGTSLFAEGIAAGEGGTTGGAAGVGGYYCNKTDTIAANTAYSYAIGAAGTGGGGNGGDLTWRTNVMVVPGGGSATSAVGDVTRAGAAASGTPGGNTTGGASSGTLSAASTSTPGEANGAPGVTGNLNARDPGAGGSSTAAAQKAGAIGHLRLQCFRHPPLTGAYVTALGEHRDSANTTERILPAPGTHQAGDYVIALCGFGGSAAAPTCAQADGGTYLATQQQGTAGCATVFVRTATGTDDMTIGSANIGGAFRTLRVRGVTGGIEASGSVSSSSSAVNAGTHTPTGGSLSRLVLTFGAIVASANNACNVSGFPADYRVIYTPQNLDSNNRAGLVTGARTETASSYSPAWTGNVEQWAAITVTLE